VRLIGPSLVALLGVVVLGCSTTTTHKSGSVTPKGSFAVAGPILDPDGLGVVTTGEAQPAAVAAMTRYLGTPTATTSGDCKDTTEVQWSDLSLEFTSGTLTGYRYLRGGLGAVGSTRRPTGAGNPLLKTATGATLGMPLSQVRNLYPPNNFSAVQGGAIVVTETSGSNRLFLGFFGTDPPAPLTEVKGGSPCGDF
jgi:hypothetical protein